jgi:ribonuclease HII
VFILENHLLNSRFRSTRIDEAGRGPLAGPVVAAAVIVPSDLVGIMDSKKITKEDDREYLYEQLITMEGIRWAVSIVDAARIDEVNILQATLEGMRSATQAIMGEEVVPITLAPKSPSKGGTEGHTIRVIRTSANVNEQGCYVVCPTNALCMEEREKEGRTPQNDLSMSSQVRHFQVREGYFALVDGNRLPRDMPCMAEPMVKGDSKEFSIAAASILAKVTRDRLMHGYDELYPMYNLKQHKGYPTQAHMKAVQEHGASPIHRRTFAPLKHMQFDEDGRIL